jgi:biopolymer transport protein ExbD
MRQRSRHRRLSLTSLIDVIFLLLLFFMLTSTFTRFAEVELSTGAGAADPADARPVFAQLNPQTLRLNGNAVALDGVPAALAALEIDPDTTPVLLALGEGVTAQRLTDALAAFRAVPGLRLTVLGAS